MNLDRQLELLKAAKGQLKAIKKTKEAQEVALENFQDCEDNGNTFGFQQEYQDIVIQQTGIIKGLEENYKKMVAELQRLSL